MTTAGIPGLSMAWANTVGNRNSAPMTRETRSTRVTTGPLGTRMYDETWLRAVSSLFLASTSGVAKPGLGLAQMVANREKRLRIRPFQAAKEDSVRGTKEKGRPWSTGRESNSEARGEPLPEGEVMLRNGSVHTFVRTSGLT